MSLIKTSELSTAKLVSLAHRQIQTGEMSKRVACNIISRNKEEVCGHDSDVWKEAIKICKKARKNG